MKKTFLTAEWRKLLMVSYEADPALLLPYLPAHTVLDLHQGRAYISLVGFLFRDTRLKGIPVPFHRHFEEINLRFYVRAFEQGEWKRGVVFIKEIVPRPALSFVARTIYKEPYETAPTSHIIQTGDTSLQVAYSCRKQGAWHRFSVTAHPQPQPVAADSTEHFITEHYWGYTRIRSRLTSAYEVQHPQWQVYPVIAHEVQVDFAVLYGARFGWLNGCQPASVLLAEGSAIAVLHKTDLTV